MMVIMFCFYETYIAQAGQISKQSVNVLHSLLQEVLVFIFSMRFDISNEFRVHIVLGQFVGACKQFLDAHAYIQQVIP